MYLSINSILLCGAAVYLQIWLEHYATTRSAESGQDAESSTVEASRIDAPDMSMALGVLTAGCVQVLAIIRIVEGHWRHDANVIAWEWPQLSVAWLSTSFEKIMAAKPMPIFADHR